MRRFTLGFLAGVLSAVGALALTQRIIAALAEVVENVESEPDGVWPSDPGVPTTIRSSWLTQFPGSWT